MARRLAMLTLLLGLLAGGVTEAAPARWAEKLYNPKPTADDLVLPMPCGGAMAFRKVDVPTESWAEDKPIVLGAEDPNLAYAEGLRQGYLGGSFADPKAPARRYFWLGKYEVSQLQWAAVQGGCPSPTLRGRLPQTGVNWYTAVEFAERYSEWLYRHALDQLPQEAGVPGFLRLPTEAEWEYAARGGSAVSAADFQARTFPTPDGLNRYAWYAGTESAQGKLQLTGLLQPNPLGLYDILGNAEEIVLEPFRLSTRSRLHGQAGGFITKGGHYLTAQADLRSAYRREYSHFDAAKRAPTQVETIGFRLVLSGTVIPTHERLAALKEQWQNHPATTPTQDELSELAQLRRENAELREKLAAYQKVPPGGDQELTALTRTAQGGDVFAQYKLGQRYASGQGVAQDDTEAANWYRKAAEGGHIEAQRELGLLYAQGRGVSQDDAEAITWLRKAAERGDATAQHELGVRYEQGQGVLQDDQEAVKWYRMAAEQGHVEAGESLKRVEAGLKAKELEQSPLLAGLELVPIKGGCFQMGSPSSEAGRDSDEKQHQVCLEDFRIGKYEVTVGQFRKFVESANYQTEAEQGDGCYGWTGSGWDKDKKFNWRNPGFAQEDDHPVVCVSWNDAVAYTKWLSQQTGKKYRLPMEVEWEYAARAGTETARFWGENSDQGCAYANAADLTLQKELNWYQSPVMNCKDGFVYTAPVGHYQGNGFGLHDMLGNVWEWTCSEYDRNYGGAEQRCISNNRADGRRVVRGGSWSGTPQWVRSAARFWTNPDDRFNIIGFRLAQDF